MAGESSDRAFELSRARRGRASRLSLNAILNLAGNVAYYVAVVVTTPIAIRALGDERWGIWMLVGAAANCALLLNLGLNSAIALHVSRGVASNDLEAVGRSISAARSYLTAAAVAILITAVVGGRPLVASLVSKPDIELAYSALLASALMTAVTFPLGIYPSALGGLQRFDLLAWFRLSAGVFLIVAVLAGFSVGMGLVGFAIVMTLAPNSPALPSWIATRAILPAGCFRWRRIDLAHLRPMLAYSVSTILYASGTVLIYQSLKFIASAQLGGAIAAGQVGIAVALVQALSVAFVPLATVLQPRVGDLASSGQSYEVPRLLTRSLAAIGLLGVPSVVFLGIEANTVFNAWVGSAVSAEVVDSLAETARWMLLGQGLYAIFLPCFFVLLGLGEHRVFGTGMIITWLAITLLGIAASELRPAISTLGMVCGVGMAIFVLGVTVPAALRRFSIRIASVAWHTLGLPMLAALPGVVGLHFRPTSDQPLLDLILAAGVYGLLTLPGLLIIRRYGALG
jgi:O-antigen/teichoic acid export membrane protein